jgi:predicted nucleotidyltransferase
MLLSNNRIVIFARKGGDFMNLIENNSQKIIALCKKHKVGKLFVFGSILTDRFNEESDVDMVVDFDKVTLEDYADNYFDLKFSLEDIFGREVDLLEDKAIRNPILRRNIDNSKVLVYGFANDN